MSGKSRDIDDLLRQNVDRQLADFDWSELRHHIAGRIAIAGVQSRPRISYLTWTAAAAGVTVAAGIVILAVTMAWGPKPGETPAGWAEVAMIERTGPAGTAQVILTDRPPTARCEVHIVASDKPRREDRARASLCIIAARQPQIADHRNGRDSRDIVCLF
jgi:hypothetical protein